MEPYVRYHPSIKIKRYTYVVEVKEMIPSKHSYTDPVKCAQEGLCFAQAKYGENLLNFHVLENEKRIESWKKC